MNIRKLWRKESVIFFFFSNRFFYEVAKKKRSQNRLFTSSISPPFILAPGFPKYSQLINSSQPRLNWMNGPEQSFGSSFTKNYSAALQLFFSLSVLCEAETALSLVLTWVDECNYLLPASLRTDLWISVMSKILVSRLFRSWSRKFPSTAAFISSLCACTKQQTQALKTPQRHVDGCWHREGWPSS